MRKTAAVLALIVLSFQSLTAAVPGQGRQVRYTKTALLSDREVTALAAEINGSIAKDTVVELSRYHRVQASSGFRTQPSMSPQKRKNTDSNESRSTIWPRMVRRPTTR